MSNPLRELIEEVKDLDYLDRIRRAHEFGSEHAGSPELAQWIQEVRDVCTHLSQLSYLPKP